MEVKRSNFVLTSLDQENTFKIPNVRIQKDINILKKNCDRPALGEIRNIPRDNKNISTRNDFKNDSLTKSNISKRSFKHVQSKVDSNLHPNHKPLNNNVTTRPVRRQESTSCLTNKTSVRRQESTSCLANKASVLQKLKLKTDPKPIKLEKPKECVNDDLGLSSEMIQHCENLELIDKLNPLMLVEYKNDIYKYLRSLEVEHCLTENFLKGKSITYKMRSILINWLVEVHLQFKLLLETLHMTISILDRYLQESSNVLKQELQLVGITAMVIACKYEETYQPDLQDFVYMSDNTYTKKQIRKMEYAMLQQLKFNLSPPLPVHFLRRYSKVSGVEPIQHAMAKYFIELLLIDYGTCFYKPSEISAAAICLAMTLVREDAITPKTAWTPVLQYFSSFKFNQIEMIVYKLARIICNTKATNTSVTEKYSCAKLMKVSVRSELKSPLIKKLADKAC